MEWRIEVENLQTHETVRHSLSGHSVRIGRGDGNDLVIADDHVSREHLLLEWRDGTSYVEDRRSVNGTSVFGDGTWSRITGRSRLRLPARLMLANDVCLRVAVQTGADKSTQTAILAPQSAVSLSQVLSIKELEKEESLMVLDLCDSTRIASIDEAMAFHLKKRLESVSTAALSSNGVRFYKRTGDGFLASFPLPIGALRAAREIIGLLSARNQVTRNEPIHVKIALHKGKTYTIDSASGDIHGNDVNVTFRLEGIGPADFIVMEGGIPARDRILCTRVFLEEIKGFEQSERLHYYYCGLVSLKGIDKPFEIFCLE